MKTIDFFVIISSIVFIGLLMKRVTHLKKRDLMAARRFGHFCNLEEWQSFDRALSEKSLREAWQIRRLRTDEWYIKHPGGPRSQAEFNQLRTLISIEREDYTMWRERFALKPKV